MEKVFCDVLNKEYEDKDTFVGLIKQRKLNDKRAFRYQFEEISRVRGE